MSSNIIVSYTKGKSSRIKEEEECKKISNRNSCTTTKPLPLLKKPILIENFAETIMLNIFFFLDMPTCFTVYFEGKKTRRDESFMIIFFTTVKT